MYVMQITAYFSDYCNYLYVFQALSYFEQAEQSE